MRARRFLNHAKLSSRGTHISLIDRRDRDLLASQSPQHTCRVSASSLLRCASSRPTHSWCSRLYAPWGLEARARLDHAADRTGSCVPAKDTHDHSCSLDPQALPLTRLSRSAPAFSAPFMMVDEPASKVSDPTPSPAPAEQKGFDWTQYVCWLLIASSQSHVEVPLTPLSPPRVAGIA